jgi:hypothetical protein
MSRRILERGSELAVLRAVTKEAARGAGSVVLVNGEAGIGKSSLVRALRAELPAEGRMLRLLRRLRHPRTLGPLRDLVGSVGAELAAAVEGRGDRDALLSALRAELARPGRLTVLVIEDVHWADDATLDTLRYLVRRIAALPTVLVLTYRDDELRREHPLLVLLGEASRGDGVRRLPLRRLSEGAVRELSAGSSVASAQTFTDAPYDLVATFDCLHDMGDPLGPARHIREMLAVDGTWMVPGNLNPVGRVYYSFSTFLCVPNALSQDGGYALGAQAGEAAIRRLTADAGFARFRRVAETPFNLVYEARP